MTLTGENSKLKSRLEEKEFRNGFIFLFVETKYNKKNYFFCAFHNSLFIFMT